MIEKSMKVRLSDGLEFGPATMFVQVASKYKSRIYVLMDNKEVNAKSIMGMLTLGMVEGEDVLITAEGEDEAKAIAEIEQFLSE